jgi:hypothetical protein
VPLKWASDAATGAPRYIHDPDIVSQAANAVCPGCGSKLWTVLAGEPQRVRPTAHFRHVAGTPRTACVVVAARLAASHHLASLGYIDLPRRRVSAVSKGFSGEGYEGWVEEPAQRVRISDVRMVDLAAAELTLDDGRTILVDLTGERVEGEAGRAVITINLSDPALAEMDVDAMRARLRLLPPVSWCSHWRDRDLTSQARSRAADEARQALDTWTDEDEAGFQAQLPPGTDPEATATMRRETLLHRTVKSILEDARRIRAPGLHVAVQRDAPDGYGDGWDDHRVEILWWSAPAELSFEAVELERRLGRIVPDVVGLLAEPRPRILGGMATRVQRGDDEDEDEQHDEFPAHWSEAVLIEVAVTHKVDEEKLRKIRHLDLPTLEIDLGAMGGRLTLDGLRRLVVDGCTTQRCELNVRCCATNSVNMPRYWPIRPTSGHTVVTGCSKRPHRSGRSGTCWHSGRSATPTSGSSDFERRKDRDTSNTWTRTARSGRRLTWPQRPWKLTGSMGVPSTCSPARSGRASCRSS